MAPFMRYLALLFLLTVFAVCANSRKSNAVARSRREADIQFPFKFRIVTLQSPPYVIFSQGTSGVEYTGFLPDLIYKMSRRLHFDYEIYPSPDDKYGAKNEDGSWSGLIGQLQMRKYNNDSVSVASDTNIGADMAAAPLTMTSQREEVVDFVKPFHHLGLILAVQKAYMANNDTDKFPFDFSIFRPLSEAVWGLIFLIALAVSILLALLNHFNPYEWGGRYKMGLAKDYQRDSFTFPGSLWFVFTSLQWQGFERAPRSIAAKILTFFWFVFVTLTLVTYIGALVNHLWWASMIQRHNPAKHPIADLADLVSNDFKDFKVGCVKGGSTYRYVTEVAAPKKEEFNLIKQFWETEEGEKQLVKSTREGMEKVRKEKYVFILETMTARYEMNKAPCDLTTIGQQFALRSYGLALPKNSPFLEAFHKVILELNEEGEIDSLEQKWWEGRGECWNVTDMEKTMEKTTLMYVRNAKPKAVDLKMFWGIIVLIVLGMVISILAAVGEILYYRYRGRHSESNQNRMQIPPLPKLENE